MAVDLLIELSDVDKDRVCEARSPEPGSSS
jgi:hypothetical protein